MALNWKVFHFYLAAMVVWRIRAPNAQYRN
jgi:hypothetical protein